MGYQTVLSAAPPCLQWAVPTKAERYLILMLLLLGVRDMLLQVRDRVRVSHFHLIC